MIVKAAAKINLMLDVVGKLPNGYHSLFMIMQSVSCYDTVRVDRTGENGIKIISSDERVPKDEKNIAYKAAEAFFDYAGISDRGIEIEIGKKIPMAAGLAGGSADGAAVLTGLDRLFETGLSEGELISIGARIGADIPFCIKGGCGYCTGIGEIIEPLPAICGCVLIGKGKAGISTAEAFGKIDSLGSGIGISGIKQIFGNVSSLTDIAPFCRNIFDDVTSLEEVTNIKRIMTENGAVCSAMTGSGSAVFGLFESENVAVKAQKVLKQKNYFTALCRLS